MHFPISNQTCIIGKLKVVRILAFDSYALIIEPVYYVKNLISALNAYKGSN